MRLDRKLEGMGTHVFKYLLKHPADKIKSDMENFSLAGFQRRMEKRKKEDKETFSNAVHKKNKYK